MKDEGIVFEDEGKLYLNTALSQDAFAKTRSTERLEEKGFLAELKDGSWCFSDWAFTGTLVKACGLEEDSLEEVSAAKRTMLEKVFLSGKAFGGKTLARFFKDEASYGKDAGGSVENGFSSTEKADSTEITVSTEQDEWSSRKNALLASAAVCSAIECALVKGVDLPDNGGEGIFVSSNFDKIIFLPKVLFETTALCFGDKTYSEYQGIYIYKSLEGKAALRFTESVIAYRALTKEFPFVNLNSDKRLEDYVDHNFVKLSEKVYGINEKLSFFIDNALQRNPKVKSHKKPSLTDRRSLNEKITTSVREGITAEQNAIEEKRAQMAGMKFPLAAFYKEAGLNEDGSAPSTGTLNTVERSLNIPKDIWKERTEKALLSFSKKLKVKRWIRKNMTVLIITFCVAVVLGFIIGSFWKTSQESSTTVSLSSAETAQMFYSAMNNLDVATAQNCVTGRNMNSKVDVISNFYVSSKSRSAYQPQYECVSPASWMWFNSDYRYTIFGLTQLEVDGVQGKLDLIGPLKKTKPEPLSSEGGKTLTKGTTATHQVTYYMVYTQGEDGIAVVKSTDTVTLTWTGKRWVISNIEQDYLEKEEAYSSFVEDYKLNLEAAGNNVVNAAESLSEKYTWLSTEAELLEAKKKMDERTLF